MWNISRLFFPQNNWLRLEERCFWNILFLRCYLGLQGLRTCGGLNFVSLRSTFVLDLIKVALCIWFKITQIVCFSLSWDSCLRNGGIRLLFQSLVCSRFFSKSWEVKWKQRADRWWKISLGVLSLSRILSFWGIGGFIFFRVKHLIRESFWENRNRSRSLWSICILRSSLWFSFECLAGLRHFETSQWG